MSTDEQPNDGVDWAYMVKHLADEARRARARAEAATEARDAMIRIVYGRRRINRLSQADLARAAGISQPTVAKIVASEKDTSDEHQK